MPGLPLRRKPGARRGGGDHKRCSATDAPPGDPPPKPDGDEPVPVVPDEAAGQRITLHDAFATDAGFAVLPVDHIEANQQQPRVRFDQETLDQLAASIREVGILQPLAVMRIDVSLSAAGATANVAGSGVGGSVSELASVVALAGDDAVPEWSRLSRIVTVYVYSVRGNRPASV